MSFTLTSSGAIVNKSGANVSSTAKASGALIQEFCDMAEGDVCSRTRYDWISAYATLNANFKKIIDDAVSSKASIELIKYDMKNYASRQEATIMLNVNWTTYKEAVDLLNDSEIRRAIGAT